MAIPGQESRLDRTLGTSLLIAMTLLWSWWAVKEGAFYGDILYPGLILIAILLGGLLWIAPLRLLLNNPTKLAAASLAGLSFWTLASIGWSPAPDEALADGFRGLAYLGAFGLGLWASHLLGPRMGLAALPVVGGALASGLVGVIAIWTTNDPDRFMLADRYIYPLGYYNAAAALLMIGAICGTAVAIQARHDTRLRAACGGIASFCIAMAVMSQSRGSAAAGLVAFGVLVAMSPWRTRALLHVLVIIGPVVLALPFLLDVFSTSRDGGDVIGALRIAAGAAVIAGLLGAISTAASVVGEPEATRRRSPPLQTRTRVVLLGLTAIAAAAAIVSFGNPADWIDQRVAEFQEGGTPDTSQSASRIGFNVASGRSDFWRVASEDFAENPLLGSGAGGFQYSYLQNRRTDEMPRDSHSVFMDALGELGLPGLTLIVVALSATAIAVLRSRPLGPAAAGLCAASLSVLTYWTIHAGVDWFWTYPAVTAPVFALAGAGAAPAVLGIRDKLTRGHRLLLGLCVAVIGIACVPLFGSERLTETARTSWDTDLSGAYLDLSRASALNPLADTPSLVEAEIARQSDDYNRGIEALGQAISRQPDEWAAYFFRARLLARDHPSKAADDLTRAAALFPGAEQVERLGERLGLSPSN